MPRDYFAEEVGNIAENEPQKDYFAEEIGQNQAQMPQNDNLLNKPVETLIKSGGEAIGGIFSAIGHPIQTAKAIGGIVKGGIEKLTPGEQENEKNFDAVIGFYKDRYGNIEAAKKTMLEDPIGFAMDLSAFFTAGGGAVSAAGKAGKLAGVAKVGQAISKAGQAIDPLAAAARGAGSAIKAVTKGKAVAPFAKGVDAKTIQAAKEAGINLPASATTTSRVVPLIEATVAKGLFGNDLVDKIREAGAGLSAYADDVIKKAGGTSDLSSAGLEIFKGADAYRNNFIKIKSALYEKAAPKTGIIKVDPKESYNFVNKILKEKRQASSVLGKTEDLSYFQNIASKLEPRSKGGKFIERTVDGAVLRSAIKELNNKINNANDVISTGNKGTLKKLVTLLSQDLDNAISTQRPEMANALKEANAFYIDGISKLNSSYGEKIFELAKSKQFDKIVPAIINNSTSVDDIPRIFEIIGAENVNNLRSSFLDEFFKKARSGENFTPMGISRQIKSMGDNKLKALLSTEQYDSVKNIDKIAQGLGRTDKIVSGSQTAFIGRMVGELSTLFVNPLKGLSLIGGDAMLSKFISSPQGKKFLLEGYSLTNLGKEAGDLVSEAGRYTKPLRAANIARENQGD